MFFFAVKAEVFFSPSVYVFTTLLFGVCTRLDLCRNFSPVILNVLSYFFVYRRP